MNSAFNSLSNFLFIPSSIDNNSGELIELTPCESYQSNAFFLLPYQNPQQKKAVPLFYKMGKKTIITLNKNITEASPILLKCTNKKKDYIQTVNELKQQIQQGNIYEINYCIDFFAQNIEIDPLQVFIKLNQISKAPYACLVKLNNDFIISASPELYLKKEGEILITKPIKGTAKRGKTNIEDAKIKSELFNNVKERTENVMAVDVARNDLSQIAKKGTVSVNKLYNIETFETVHQMVSTVSCQLKDSVSFDTILDATFPMASMTGAPKFRAMQLIDEYENFDRKFYSGAMGCIDGNDDFTLAVNIRSIFYNQHTKYLSIAVGSAITYLSNPEEEYNECLLKANALLVALNAKLESQ